MRAEANAKVNLALRVVARRPDGYHRITSLAHSIDWSDTVEVTRGDEDGIEVNGPGPAGEDNLAWRAVLAVREALDRNDPLRLRLDKRIPIAAGLGGGSADAAAALTITAALLVAPAGLPEDLSAGLGADVPFCLRGGFSVVAGIGDELTALDPLHGFVLGLVTPRLELRTADVYARWDRLGGPEGAPVPSTVLPPSLRMYAPFSNDLLPAALDLAPELGDTIADLRAAWDRPVLLSGSGPTLFGFFLDRDEAAEAIRAAPGRWRARRVAVPARQGVVPGSGTLAGL